MISEKDKEMMAKEILKICFNDDNYVTFLDNIGYYCKKYYFGEIKSNDGDLDSYYLLLRVFKNNEWTIRKLLHMANKYLGENE